MINTVKDRKNLYMTLTNLDLVGNLKPLLEKGGYILRPSDSKFVPRTVSVGWDAPWVYVQSEPTARCDLYHRVFYNILGHIHTYCRSCWKIVVRPETVVQLFDLYELQKEMGVPCKCGIELRNTVGGLYGGYFYTRSKADGLSRYDEVRKLVDQAIEPGVSVILKRYCTEFELGGDGGIAGQGPSDQVPDTTPEEQAMEAYVEAHFPRIGAPGQQPKHLVAAVLRRWIHFAYAHGDATYKTFTDGNALFPDYITYHIKQTQENSYGANCRQRI